MTSPGRRLFITGTDTGVGKTHVTCLIARQIIRSGHRVAAYKPVCSGVIPSSLAFSPRWDDLERLQDATGRRYPDAVVCPQRFLAPLAPPIAARKEGKTVNFGQLIDGVNPFVEIDLLLIEGAGGWLSPLAESQTNADFAVALQCPVLIVARTGLGTINHSLLTIESIRSRGLPIAGVVMSETSEHGDDESRHTNVGEIETRGNVAVLGTVLYGDDFELHRNGRPVTIDWYQRAGR